MPGLVVPFITFTVLYIFLAVITVWLLLRQVAASPRDPAPIAKEARVAA
jgi:cytochrome bd-type quinol oxidase subunit 1